jgi:hypothetical protein
MKKKQIQEELKRFNQIYKYKFIINEQEVPPPPPPSGDVPPPPGGEIPPPPPSGDVPPPPGGEVPPPPSGAAPIPESNTEEVDITDLVNMTKSIKKDIDDNRQNNDNVMGQMDAVFTKLDDLENKLSQMDSVIAKIDELGSKVQEMKPKSPEEKLELRSLDSYPFNQNPQQFFANKQGEMRQTGKNEYVLTKDEVENYSKDTIRNTFNPESYQDETRF